MRHQAFGPRHAPSFLRQVLAGVMPPLVATTLAWLPGDVSTTIAALTYVVAVVASAATGGIRTGVIASIVSFLGLNYFFTPPVGTLRADKTEDLVALLAFLAAAVLVGSLVAHSLELRDRAERREREARILYGLSTRLLSGEPPAAVIAGVAGALAEHFGLARCAIETADGGRVEAGQGTGDESDAEVVELRAGDREVGRLLAVPGAGRPLGDRDRAVLRAFGGQLSLAVEAARLGAEAAAATGEAEASKVRAALFSSVTHDLRTPLASIKASVTSLQDEAVEFAPGERRDLLQTILEETDRLNRMVGNLLDLSRMRAGALVPAREAASVADVIAGVLQRLRSTLDGRPVAVRVADDLPDLPIDVMQLDQALSNLVENAVKFSPAGSPIDVTASRFRDAVQVRVVDHGGGIPEAEREQVFEPFYRRAGDRESPGTGLGLAIARAVVTVHGGRIRVEGTPAGGTTIVIELPLDAERYPPRGES